ncbi:MAG: lysylphosphatidylglycerol synthase domain-containing protein [Methylotetracoccus sp.]
MSSAVRQGLLRMAALVLLAALTWRMIGPGPVMAHLQRLNLGTVLLMIAVNAFVLAASTVRWHGIAALAGGTAPRSLFFRATWFSWGAAEFGPSLLAAESARFLSLRGYLRPAVLSLSQLADRVSGIVGLALLNLLCLPRQLRLLEGFGAAGSLAVVASALLAVGLVLIVARRSTGRVGGSHVAELRRLLADPVHYLWSLSINAAFALNIALACGAIGRDLPFMDLFSLAPLLLLGVASLPGLVSDWGKREGLAVAVFVSVGLSPADSIALSVLFGAVHTVTALPGLWFGLPDLDRRCRAPLRGGGSSGGGKKNELNESARKRR